jgi:1-acyl-sn-glycerol-3-phosphate acyltransferase
MPPPADDAADQPGGRPKPGAALPRGVVVRSVVFNVLFYVVLLAYLLAMVPTLLMPRMATIVMAKSWGRTSLWLLRVVCGTDMAITGRERIPAGAMIVASKHQSLWETFALVPLFADPTFIIKRELMWIPLFGWYTWKGEMIPVKRGARSVALAAMAERARFEVGRGRQIIIFPEGTRRAAGAEPAYKFGVARLYADLGVPCLPIALNSGLFWRRRSFLRFPGTIRVEILPPIPPGLQTDDFMARLQGEIETATGRLLRQAEAEGAPSASKAA